ncbi:MTERF4 [Symbiodinium sp. CCMP2592]|nr:MTERF4 [Symbiodinium sp. CCMP2592]
MTCVKSMGCCEVSWRRLRGSGWLLSCFLLGLAACGPPWWKKGRPRKMHRSYTEIELLSRLAELLMPQTPIRELFRDFPVGPSQEPRWLSPGIAAFGVLQDERAALFVEYAGSDGHTDAQDGKGDELKTNALLQYAPEGSRVLRVCHTARDSREQDNTVEAIVNVWREGHEPSLMKAVSQTVWVLLSSCHIALREDVRRHLEAFTVDEPKPRFKTACAFTSKPVLIEDIRSKTSQVLAFLEGDLAFSSTQVKALARRFPRIWHISVDDRLKPVVAWLDDIGLSRQQVAKVVAKHPHLLGCRIETNLKPAVVWLEGLGLTRQQVAKVISAKPQVLGCSLENNLKPKVAWLQDLGLSPKQVAKVFAGSSSILGCSVKGNLQPTVAWLHEVGLSRRQVAKVIAGFPAILGYSIEANLKPTAAWLEDIGLNRRQVAKVVAGCPRVLGFSITANLKPKVAWLLDIGLSRPQVSKVVFRLPQMFGYTVDAKLKPKVAWLGEVGLTQLQVAGVVAAFPQLLSLSIEKNLSPKHLFLLAHFSRDEVRDMIVRLPALLGFSFSRLRHRLHVLQKHNALSRLPPAMTWTDADFAEQFMC